MTKRDSFLLRIKPEVLEALRAWADDEFRSLNGQIEFVLHRALENSGRLRKTPISDSIPNQPHQQSALQANPSSESPSKKTGQGDSQSKKQSPSRRPTEET